MAFFNKLPHVQIFFWGFVFLSLPFFILASLRDAFQSQRSGAQRSGAIGATGAPPLEEPQDYGYSEPEAEEALFAAGTLARTEAVLPLQRTAQLGVAASQTIAAQSAFPAVRPRELPIPGAAGWEDNAPEIDFDIFDERAGRDTLAAGFPAAVRFEATAPYRVTDRNHFEITVRMEGAEGRPRSLSAAGSSEPDDMLMTKIERGSRIVLVLECMPVTEGARRGERPVSIDAPYQALSWEGRPLTAIFAARAVLAGGDGHTNLLLWIIADGVERGTIDFDIAVEPSSSTAAREVRIETERTKSGMPAATAKATLFERVLICSAHEDRERVATLIAAIKATKLEYRADGFDLDREDDGLALVRDWVQTADIVYIVWSAAAAASPAMQKKLKLIRSEQIGRKLLYRRRHSKRLAVCVVRAGDCLEEPPNWLYDDGGYEKALSAF